jgi:seryl-tRNA synthetase
MVLQYQLAYVQHTLQAATSRKERLEDLMQRKGVKKWAPAKKAQMVRRLVATNQIIEQCTAATDELAKKMEEILAKMASMPRAQANVVPPPPETGAEPAEATAPQFVESGIENPFGS